MRSISDDFTSRDLRPASTFRANAGGRVTFEVEDTSVEVNVVDRHRANAGFSYLCYSIRNHKASPKP